MKDLKHNKYVQQKLLPLHHKLFRLMNGELCDHSTEAPAFSFFTICCSMLAINNPIIKANFYFDTMLNHHQKLENEIYKFDFMAS